MIRINPSILSKTVKVITPKTEKVEEAQIRGTIVYRNQEHFVQLDGAPSNALTPIAEFAQGASDAGFVHGDRVLVLIKNHQAIVTKNLTTGLQAQAAKEASAFTTAITDEGITAQRIIANDTFTNTLRANHITADEIIAGMATIDTLDANYAHITNGVIDNAKIGVADVNDLSANYAHITTGVIDNAKIDVADVNNLSANYAHITTGVIDNAKIDVADVNNLSANYAHITNGVIDNAKIGHADVNGLNANYAHITNGTIDNAKIGHADVNGLNANYAQINAANVTDLSAQNAWVNKIMVQTGLIAHEGTVFTLDAIQVNAANITAGTLDVNRLIVTVDGEKYLVEIDPTTHQPSYEKLDGGIVEPRTITADKIVAHDITVQEITTENLVGTNGWINLNQGKFFYGDGANFASATNAISWNGSKLQIKADEFLLSTGQTIQDSIESVENWFYSVPPTTSNPPASSWTTTNLKEQHLRDIYFDTTSGKSYRWAKEGSTYKWIEIEDVELSALAKDLHDNYPPRSEFTVAPDQIQSTVSAAQTAATNAANSATDTKLQSYYTKTQTDSAITQRAGEISLSVAQTEIEKIKVGGRNVLQGNLINDARGFKTTEDFQLKGWATQIWNSSAVLSMLEPNTQYTVHYDVEVISLATAPTLYSRNVGFLLYSNSTSAARINWNSDTLVEHVVGSKGHYEKTFTTPATLPSDYEIFVYTARYTTNGNTPYDFDTIKFSNLKLEKGNKVTDWTPAPEDVEAYTDDAVSTAKAEIKITTDGISTEVSKKTDKATIISTIRQSAETVKIKASQVEIDGSAIFNAISGDVDTAINTVVDDIEVGGKNLLSDTRDFGQKNTTGIWLGDTGLSTLTTNKYNGTIIRNYPSNTISSGAITIVQYYFPTTNNSFLEHGQSYCLSFWAKGSGKFRTYLYSSTAATDPTYCHIAKYVASDGDVGTSTDGSKVWTLVNEWKRYWIVYTFDTTGHFDNRRLLFRHDYNASATFAGDFCGIKFEVGNKATDWTPAPEDVQAEINAIPVVRNVIGKTADGTADLRASTSTILGWNNDSSISFRVDSTSGLRVGDIARVRVLVSDMNDAPAYVTVQVTNPDSSVHFYGVCKGVDTTVIDGGHILTNSITANQIASNAIQASELDTDNINNSGLLTTTALTVGEREKILNSNVSVGGRNLLLNTVVSNLNREKCSFPSAYISTTMVDGIICYKFTGNNTVHGFNYTDNWSCLSSPLKANTTYTYSFWAKYTKAASFNFTSYGHFQVNNANSSSASDKTHEDVAEKRVYSPSSVAANVWTKMSITFTTNNLNGSSFGIFPLRNNGADAIMYAYGFKLEEGNKATDWTPAPEDAFGENIIRNTDATTVHSVTMSSTESGFKNAFSVAIPRVSGENVYTVSFDAKATTAHTVKCFWYGPNTTTAGKSSTGQTTGSVDGNIDLSLTTAWQRYSITWVQSDTDATNKNLILCRVFVPSSGSVTTSVRAVKMEVGAIAKPWSVAPEDLAATATTYITDIDSQNGITIKPAIKTGNDYLQINSQAIDIVRNNISMVSMDDTNIRVGKSSSQRVVVQSDGVYIYNPSNVQTGYYGSFARIGGYSDKNVRIDSNGIYFNSSQDNVISSFSDTIRVGKVGQKNIQITNTNLNVYDDDGSIPFQVSTAASSSSQAYTIAWYIKASSSYSTSAYFKGNIVNNTVSVGVATSGIPTASNTITLTNAGTEYTITVSGVKYTFTRYTGILIYKIENTNTAKRSCLVSFTQSYKETFVRENTHILDTRYQSVSIEDITGTCYSSTLYAYAGVAQLTLRVYHGSSSVSNGGLIYKGRLGGFAPIYDCYMVGHLNGVYAVSGVINNQGEIFVYNTSGGSRTVSSSNYASLSATYLLAQ